MSQTVSSTDNPLLRWGELPAFTHIEPAQIAPALEQKLADNRSRIESLLDGLGTPTWQTLMAPLEQWEDELEQLWAPVSHLNGVMNTEALREAYAQGLAGLTAYATELGQHEGLFQAVKALAEGEAYKELDGPRRRALDNQLRDFKLSGIALEGEQRERFAAIKQRLAELSTQFSNQVLDATQGWHYHCESADELAGVPDSALALYRQLAEAKEFEGYVISLDIPAYLPAMQHAENRNLREQLYAAYTSRASDSGPNAGQWDNGPIMVESLALKAELAALLGFANYAERSLATKMADSPDQVLEFLQQLAAASKAQAEKEYAELAAFATEQGLEKLEAWDVPYYSERLRESRYAVSDEELKPYFPADRVISGMFEVVAKLFGIDIEEQVDVEAYHPDMRFYRVVREGKLIANFYLDIYAREAKRGGAWMADCRVRRQTDQGLQLPVAFLTCNFSQPTESLPSLLTHNEVTTLFHEFGHGLHHMLTQIDCAAVSGINGVAWDAVELPSQFLENWCWQPEVIPLISGHYQSGEPLPQDLLDKLLAAKNFQSAMQMMRQLEFALFDMRLHAGPAPADVGAIQAVLDAVRAETSVYPVPINNRFQNSFSHIFAGGYSAGYYSYKWAEVLSADAFGRFEEEGIFNADTGRAFLENILELGGSEDAADLFKAFRGRAPEVDALLRHSGIQK